MEILRNRSLESPTSQIGSMGSYLIMPIKKWSQKLDICAWCCKARVLQETELLSTIIHG